MTVATKTESNVQQAVTFFWVRDIDESLRFYIDGLGFTKTIEWVDDGKLRWCWLELGGAAVMLQEFWQSGQHRNATTDKAWRGRLHQLHLQGCAGALQGIQSPGRRRQATFRWKQNVGHPRGRSRRIQTLL